MLFLEYDFLVVYKLGKSHLVADALSRLPTFDEPSGMPNQITNVPLFLLQLAWLQKNHDYLQIRDFSILYTSKQKQKLTLRALLYVLQQGKLYK